MLFTVREKSLVVSAPANWKNATTFMIDAKYNGVQTSTGGETAFGRLRFSGI